MIATNEITEVKVVAQVHTKKGHTFYIVKTNRVSREVYQSTRELCEDAGGWYSRKFGKSPGGYAFEKESDAQAFAAKLR